MALPVAATYDKMDRPYNASMQRTVFSDTVANVPGTTQEEGGRTIKTGEALTDVWIDTWIKSRTYQPKTQGFLLDSKGGYIECMDFSIGTGIDMYGNDAYFYDYTEASGGTYIKTATASLNFMRKYYEDQNFIMQKRVGYNSPSVSQSDNVFEMFYENDAQAGRRNYIFVGSKGDNVSRVDEHTDILSLYGDQGIQINTGVGYKYVSDMVIASGAFPAASWASDSTRVLINFKNATSTKYFDPTKVLIPNPNPADWQAGAIVLGEWDPLLNPGDPSKATGAAIIIDHQYVWLGQDMRPMLTNMMSLGSTGYNFLKSYIQTMYSTNAYVYNLYLDATHYISYGASKFQFNAPIGTDSVWLNGGANSMTYSSSSFQFNATIRSTGDVYAGSGAGSVIAGSSGYVVCRGSYFRPQSITYMTSPTTSATKTFLVV